MRGEFGNAAGATGVLSFRLDGSTDTTERQVRACVRACVLTNAQRVGASLWQNSTSAGGRCERLTTNADCVQTLYVRMNAPHNHGTHPISVVGQPLQLRSMPCEVRCSCCGCVLRRAFFSPCMQSPRPCSSSPPLSTAFFGGLCWGRCLLLCCHSHTPPPLDHPSTKVFPAVRQGGWSWAEFGRR